MAHLIVLFVVIPVVELLLLIELGRHIGTLPTIGLVIVTGVLGAWLARRQGLGVLRRIRDEVAAGRMPVDSLVDGVIILVAGAVLLTPGVLTDLFGFLCLVPWTRKRLRRALGRRFKNAIREGRVQVHTDFQERR